MADSQKPSDELADGSKTEPQVSDLTFDTTTGMFIGTVPPLQYNYGMPPEGADVFWEVSVSGYGESFARGYLPATNYYTYYEALWHRVTKATPKGFRLSNGDLVLSKSHRPKYARTVALACFHACQRKDYRVNKLQQELQTARIELASLRQITARLVAVENNTANEVISNGEQSVG